MKQIWKFPLVASAKPILGDRVSYDIAITVEMPAGAKVRFVECQGSTPTVWAEVDTEQRAMVKRRFYVVATGQDIPDDAVHHMASGVPPIGGAEPGYHGSFLVRGGVFVFHIYEGA